MPKIRTHQDPRHDILGVTHDELDSLVGLIGDCCAPTLANFYDALTKVMQPRDRYSHSSYTLEPNEPNAPKLIKKEDKF